MAVPTENGNRRPRRRRGRDNQLTGIFPVLASPEMPCVRSKAQQHPSGFRSHECCAAGRLRDRSRHLRRRRRRRRLCRRPARRQYRHRAKPRAGAASRAMWSGSDCTSPTWRCSTQRAEAVRPARSRHRGRQPRPSAAEDRAIWRGPVHRGADGAADRGQDRVRRDPSVRRRRLSRLGAPRRLDVLHGGARTLRELSARAGARRGLHPLRHPRFHRRQLFPGAGDDPRRGRGDRGSTCSPIRSREAQIERLYMLRRDLLAASQRDRSPGGGLPPARARQPADGAFDDAAAVPRRHRPRPEHSGAHRFDARGAGVRLRGEPAGRPGAGDGGLQEAGVMARHHRRPDRGRRHLRDELQVHPGNCSWSTATSS